MSAQIHFDKKISAFYESIYANGEKPVLDGILDEDIYAEQEYKILWLLKEPYGEAKEDEVRKGLMNDTETYSTIPTWKMVIRASYCLLNSVHPSGILELGIQDKQTVLKRIAFMNIKKDAGETKSREKNIRLAYQRNKSILLEQINLQIRPDIFICGNTLHHFINDNAFGLSWHLNESEKLKNKDFGLFYIERESKLFIEAFHPSDPRSYRGYIERLYDTIKCWKETRI